MGASLDEVFFCKRNHQPSLVDNTPSDTLFTNPNEPSTSHVPPDPVNSDSYRDNSLSDIVSSPLDGKGDSNHDLYHQTPSNHNAKFAATSNKNYSFLSWNEKHSNISYIF